jgi:transposase
MPFGKRLSAYEVGQVDALLKEGKSNNYIAKQLNRSEKCIRTYIKTKATYFEKRPNGAKSVMSDGDKRQLIRHVSATGDSVKQAKEALQLTVSQSTILRVLNGTDTLKYVKAKTKPKLTPRHVSDRLEFARLHMTWQLEWRSVIFSDEKKFNLDGPDGYKHYWHDLRKEDRLLSRRVHGGASLMVWAAFCFSGKTRIVFRPCSGDSEVYQTLLERNLLPFIDELGGGQWIFQQDGASVHRSASTMEWLRSHQIEVLSWPALSPDLNPIENLWGILSRAVYESGHKQFNSVDELQSAVEAKWNAIDISTLETLTESMPRRMYEVISGGGASIKY